MGAVVLAAVLLGPAVPGVAAAGAPESARPGTRNNVPVATGYGGAVATVDPHATKVGIGVLRRGGNAVDAAVAAAATLGVTEPFSSGIGGGGFFVYYDAGTRQVQTIDGRETAPLSMPRDAFIDLETGEPYPFYPDRVTGGVSVGVPGTLLTWAKALERWGTADLAGALRPAERIAYRGFGVDKTFHDQVAENEPRFEIFGPTRRLYLPGGKPPAVGSTFRNRDLARTYREIARKGLDAFYSGPITRGIVDAVRQPPVDRPTDLPVPPGYLTPSDLATYDAPFREPTRTDYRGVEVYGMAPPSSGGSTVGEALNILERFDLGSLGSSEALHHYFEASALAFADRDRYVGDSDYVDVPLEELLSEGFAAERACLLDPDRAMAKPVEPGSPDGSYAGCGDRSELGRAGMEGASTTHLTVADRWGNVVSHTLTIEQIGGSGIVVPGRGFLLNNELTDFNPEPTQGEAPDPNLVEGGKRPRSSMSPTIVLRGGAPYLAVGTPGGSTIITTVLQLLVERLDRGMTLPEAIAAPRAAQRNAEAIAAEPAFLASPEAAELRALGHEFSGSEEIGAATGIEFLPDGRLRAAAEPRRRGGGSAGVVSTTSVLRLKFDEIMYGLCHAWTWPPERAAGVVGGGAGDAAALVAPGEVV
ncbi:MAG: gamma-glutamyltransferase, partial [Streptosporangiales bacterium]|nr:gamma-glutamyltransferase [Streptosporangiales bacterium]